MVTRPAAFRTRAAAASDASSHRDAAAGGVEQAVDQVQVARPAAGRADGQLAGDRRLAGRGEGGGLLVADVFPGDRAVPAQGVGAAHQGRALAGARAAR
jgi:hypothetical protein